MGNFKTSVTIITGDICNYCALLQTLYIYAASIKPLLPPPHSSGERIH